MAAVGEKLWINQYEGTVVGVGSDRICVELDKPWSRKDNKGQYPFRRTIRYVFARQVTKVGGIASVTFWCTTDNERKLFPKPKKKR